MAQLNNKILVSELVSRNNSFIKIVREKYSKLSEVQLNTKPTEGKWSIAECLIHIIKADEIYMKQFEEKIVEKPGADLSYKPGWLGNWFAENIVPKENKLQSTMKSLKIMDPQSNIDLLTKEFPDTKAVLDTFEKQQMRLSALMKTAINTNLGDIKIQTAIPLVKIKMGDAFRFVVGHNERHIWQAEGVYNLLFNR